MESSSENKELNLNHIYNELDSKATEIRKDVVSIIELTSKMTSDINLLHEVLHNSAMNLALKMKEFMTIYKMNSSVLKESITASIEKVKSSMNAFFDIVQQLTKCNAEEELKSLIMMFKMSGEQLDGSLVQASLSVHGLLTDLYSTRLFAACGQGLEEICSDMVDISKQYACKNVEADKHAFRTQVAYASIQTVLATLKFCVPIILNSDTRQQILADIQTSEKAVAALSQSEGLSNISNDVMYRVDWVSKAVLTTEPDGLDDNKDTLYELRCQIKDCAAVSLYFINSVFNVTQALPSLTDLKKQVNDTISSFSKLLNQLLECLQAKDNKIEHLHLIQYRKELTDIVFKLVSISRSCIPIIHSNFGPESTLNLEKRISNIMDSMLEKMDKSQFNV